MALTVNIPSLLTLMRLQWNSQSLSLASLSMTGWCQFTPPLILFWCAEKAHRSGISGGKSYIDFAGGIADNALGHAHPRVQAALVGQAGKLWHLGNGYTNEPVLRLVKQLIDATFADKVFFCNCGAEANEAALKLVRKQAHDQYGSRKDQIVAFNNAFHGRTLFTVSAGGQLIYSRDFALLPGGITHAPYNDLAATAR